VTPVPSSWDHILQPIRDALRRPGARPCLTGVHGSTTAFALTVLARGSGSWLVVTPTEDAAERLIDDLRFFHAMLGLPADWLALFPEWETLPYEATPPHVELIAQRMQALRRLTARTPTMLVASVKAVVQRLLPRSLFLEACFALTPDQTTERETLIAKLLRLGYRRSSVVEIPGEFSVRGGIMDIYSTAYAEPMRVEFLGDTVESIRRFDPATQKSTGSLKEAWLLPARECIAPAGTLAEPAPGDEWRGPDLYPSMDPVLDYFSEPPLVVLEQPGGLARQAEEFAGQVQDAHQKRGSLPDSGPYPDPARLFVAWTELRARLDGAAGLLMEPLDADAACEPVVAMPVQSPQSVGLGLRGTPFSDTLVALDRLRAAGPVVIVARSRGQVDRLLALFAEHGLPAVLWQPASWAAGPGRKPPFFLSQGTLSAGFVSQAGLAVVTEEELFAKGLRHRPPSKTKTATFLSSLEDLNEGDFVVHVQHGIGRYRGLRRLAVQEFESDYLVLEFFGGDTLYVPLDRLNQVQRYTGAEGHVPRVDRLGGSSWARTTARVKKGIEEMAKELVDLHANREVVRRAEYAPDSTLTHEFEAAFEYEETSDQLRAIEDVKRDMEAPKPMDRLVCGDVGYGKTEVAMRAAFKAVEDNRQVAVLVPTTLLAQQHYENFAQRLAPFPIRAAMLSRFQTPKELKTILADLAAGTVDVVIGTHRLLQKDVQFRNLGLVIIDEEQWFGVRHKERLKQLRTQVDVLTLTATPIPRTLQMALAGVRDLSVIETAPPGRLSIRSQVLRFNEKTVREAVIRELARGGQTFFVHNRVQTMEKAGAWLQELVPEARVVMAHGQMDERLLESVMSRFVRGEADVLVTSAIIQSGLDLPTANTILINRADTFGLSQLYQLRGRVGRAGHQAYAYFLIPEEGALTPEAQKRLTAIQEFTELGSGFRIAAADLEIRGAGNLLGKEQSGHIAAVGLDFYLQMVEQAVQGLKGTIVEEEPDPVLRLNVSAFIPEEYVPDGHQRLSLYKRLAASPRVGDLALLHGEIQDRYGALPDPVERLFEVMQIKILAKALRLATVEVKADAVAFAFNPKVELPEPGIRALMDHYQRRLRLLSPLSFELHVPGSGWPALFAELAAVLHALLFYDTKGPAVERPVA
jgi:transcription-repair coupling factor (superfamily II helicase)